MLAALSEILGVTVAELPPIMCGRAPAPLKVGVYDDLLVRHPGADPTRLASWLRSWTGTEQYLRAMERVDRRFDLDGSAAGEIEVRHVEHARERLAKKK